MLLALSLTLGCVPDDVDDTAVDTAVDTADTADTEPQGPALVGDWLSEADDLSRLFAAAPFNYVSIDASFGTEGTYTVVGLDAEGTTYPFAGTFTVDESTDPAAIVQEQTEPYAATAQGIWSVVDDVLTFEVAQVSPDYGYTPATPETGFGSSAGPYLEEGDNVQTYQRID